MADAPYNLITAFEIKKSKRNYTVLYKNAYGVVLQRSNGGTNKKKAAALASTRVGNTVLPISFIHN